jgi:UDP-2,3-diacylglucosamine pyrophosphatase LpxH
MDEMTRVVISDLHIGMADKFDIFQSDTKLADLTSFLGYLRKEVRPVDLIINGDFVDFLQLRPWNALDRSTALGKAQQIASHSAGVLRVIGELLLDPANRLTIILGNHDVELAYDEVWGVIRAALLANAGENDANVTFLNRRQTYNPAVNGIKIHIEHGNDCDPYNSLNYTKLFQDAETGTQEFAYPPGTRFVYEVINAFKEQYTFVDLLKPEIPAVPFLLMALAPLKSLTNLPGAAGASMRALWNGFISSLRSRVVGAKLGQGPTPNADDALALQLAQSYVASLGKAAGSEAEIQNLEIFRDEGDAPAADQKTLGGLRNVKHKLMLAALRTLDRFSAAQNSSGYFSQDHATNASAQSARLELKGDVRLVIFGHTHEAMKTEFNEGVYINSGAWANLVSLPSSEEDKALLEWYGSITDNTFKRASFLTYVKVTPKASGIAASLNQWNGKEVTLWQTNIGH